MSYRGRFFELKAEAGRGWNSLRHGGVEFLREGGALVFVTADGKEAFLFPDATNMTHDENSGRMGAVSDGLHMARLTPAVEEARCRMVVGSNVPGEIVVRVHLAPGVEAAREVGGGVRLTAAGRTVWMEPVGREAEPGPVEVLTVARHRHPEGGEEGVVVEWKTRGFAAHEVDFRAEAPRWTPPPVKGARFDVHSSADPAPGEKKPLGPIVGVTNPLYGPQVKADFGMVFQWDGEKPFTGTAELEVVNSLGGVDSYEKIKVGPVAPGTRNLRVAFAPQFPRAGVMDIWGRLSDAEGQLLWVGRYRAAFDWESYRPRLRVEPDFQEFWEQTLAALRSLPLEATTERVKAFEDAPDFEVYQVGFQSWNRQRIHAMLFVPREGKRPFPALVTAHPGTTGFGLNKRADGVYGSRPKHDKRFVTIVPLIRGHEPDAPDIPFNHPWWGPLGDRDTYVARAWYGALVRAVDYLATRPDLVDMKRVVARGGSQGGAFALVTAALDPRIAYCLADCPANGQPHEIMDLYPSFGPSRGQVPAGRTVLEVQRALSYYNPVNFAPLIRCPTYVGSNIGDMTVHSLGPLAVYHNLTGLDAGQKAFYPGFTHFHGSGPGLGARTREIMDRVAAGP